MTAPLRSKTEPEQEHSAITTIPSTDRLVKEGPGWRLGWDPSRPLYPGLVGGQDWGFELTAPELDDFCRLLHQLADTMGHMRKELMEEERLCCEAESECVWLEVEGFPHSYGLRLILTQQRNAEGGWPAEIVPELTRAAQSLRAF